METALATIVGQKYAYSSEEYQSARRSCGYSTTPEYYPYLLKFTTPDIRGKIKKVTFTFSASVPSSVSIRSQTKFFAFASSDANRLLYDNTYTQVTEEYQLYTGTVNCNALTTTAKDYTIEWTPNDGDCLPNSDYYIYMWASTRSYCYIGAISNHTITVEYEPGSGGSVMVGEHTGYIRVYYGGVWYAGTPYIYHNGEWLTS